MNTGVLDTVNLSWKLAAVLQGWGGDRLLDSYEIEQRPVAERNIGEAGENLRRMLNPRVARPDAAIFDENDTTPETEAMRRKFGHDYTEMMSREWNTIGIHLGYVYENSPAIVADGTPAPADEVSSYYPTARPGSRAPHAWISDGRSTLDEFGKDFVLFRFTRNADVRSLLDAAAVVGVPLRLVDIDAPRIADLYERPLVLVRPDGQVSWRGDAIDEPEALLDRLTGRHTVAPLGLVAGS
jgi:hypothetical protein